MKTFVFASNNKHKLEEFKTILKDYKILTLDDIGFHEEIVEDGKSFEENALIKSKTVKNFLNSIGKNYSVIGEDSGLCVDSLNGAPGIFSARYAGDHTSLSNRQKLLKELVNTIDRKARFVSAIAVCFEDGQNKTFIGTTEGEIVREEKGESGFDYDCVFYSFDLNKTFGEASEEEKNRVSHRGRAIKKLQEYLNNV